MDLDKLPGFEGKEPVGTKLVLSGGSERRTRPYHIGDQIVIVVEGTVTAVNHAETKGGIVREHKLAIESAYELGGDRAPDLISELSEEYQEAVDDALGRQVIQPEQGDRYDDDDETSPEIGAAADAVLAWVDGNPVKAERASEVEGNRARPRAKVTKALDAILNGPTDDGGDDAGDPPPAVE